MYSISFHVFQTSFPAGLKAAGSRYESRPMCQISYFKVDVSYLILTIKQNVF